MKIRIHPSAEVIRALLSALCLLLLVSVSDAQTGVGRPGPQGPSIEAKAPVIPIGLAERLVSRLQADHPDLSPAELYKLLEQDLAVDGPYTEHAADLIGTIDLTTNQKLALLFAAGVVVGVLLM
jgi:hypothetical protein